MELKGQVHEVLAQYALQSFDLSLTRIGSGHINDTFLVADQYVLQRINTDIFKNPEHIANNLSLASSHLKKLIPDYLFLEPIRNKQGEPLTRDASGSHWRLFKYIKEGIAINEVSNNRQAFEAAKAFGKLTRLLEGSPIPKYKVTIEKFHDLRWRWSQFESALSKPKNIAEAEEVIEIYKRFQSLVGDYDAMIGSGVLKLRVTHNDTKINNVLFDHELTEVVCVIDLDTLMPGYFIYDLGDMVRTFASPVSEEERDHSKIAIRKDVLESTYEGYLTEMGDILSKDELEVLPLAGPVMTFMIGIRFLTDYLNGDVYYKTSYQEQNLVRATNQAVLLRLLIS